MTQIDNKRIAEIADLNPTSEAFFAYATRRARNARDGVTPLRAIRHQMTKEGFHAVPQDLLSVFKELERAGVGLLKNGEFKWNVPIKSVAEAADQKITGPIPSKLPNAKKTIIMYFANHKEVAVTFTPNLTKDECAFVVQKIVDECK